MSWDSPSKNCREKEYADFRKEWEALKHSKNKNEAALIRRIEWEEKWLGVCEECGRTIPSCKKRCPWCIESEF